MMTFGLVTSFIITFYSSSNSFELCPDKKYLS
jgi:hypothetical protein